jgi:hypothetical protein
MSGQETPLESYKNVRNMADAKQKPVHLGWKRNKVNKLEFNFPLVVHKSQSLNSEER